MTPERPAPALNTEQAVLGTAQTLPYWNTTQNCMPIECLAPDAPSYASAASAAFCAAGTCSALASATLMSLSATAARSTTPAMLTKPCSWPAHHRAHAQNAIQQLELCISNHLVLLALTQSHKHAVLAITCQAGSTTTQDLSRLLFKFAVRNDSVNQQQAQGPCTAVAMTWLCDTICSACAVTPGKQNHPGTAGCAPS